MYVRMYVCMYVCTAHMYVLYICMFCMDVTIGWRLFFFQTFLVLRTGPWSLELVDIRRDIAFYVKANGPSEMDMWFEVRKKCLYVLYRNMYLHVCIRVCYCFHH